MLTVDKDCIWTLEIGSSFEMKSEVRRKVHDSFDRLWVELELLLPICKPRNVVGGKPAGADPIS